MSNSSSSAVSLCTNTSAIAASWAAVKYSALLPLYLLILRRAFLQRRQQRSLRSLSHSDIFTFHMAALELVTALASALYIGGLYTHREAVVLSSTYLTMFSFPGQILIHCLTCVDRYLAVVHPVVFLKSRSDTGIKVRNISVCTVWFLCFASMAIQAPYGDKYPIVPLACFIMFALIVVSYCSVSVLVVLIRPGPGDGAGTRVDPSKRKAFVTITAILVTISFSFVGFTFGLALSINPYLTVGEGCVVFICAVWATVPSSLVLPLLFLKRNGIN